MQIDATVVAAVVRELQMLVGGKIQNIVQPTTDSIGLEIYHQHERHQLLLSANGQHARLHLVAGKITRGTHEPTPIMLLLRKYAKNGRITAIECPDLERVVTLSIAKMPAPRNPDDDDDDVVLTPRYSELVLEIVGHSSNLILLDDNGMILDSVRHFQPSRSPRPIMPKLIYSYPPRSTKRDPHHATADDMTHLHGDNLAKALVAIFRGVSPQLAREIAFRATGNANSSIMPDQNNELIAQTLRELVSMTTITPTLARDADGKPIAIAPFALHQFDQTETMPSMNHAIAVAFADLENVAGHAQRRAALVEQVEQVLRRVETKADQLKTQLARADQLETLRWEGEMIFGYMHTLKAGQTELMLDNAVITLDPTISWVENAQRRFKEYDKAKGAVAEIPQLLDQTEHERQQLHETLELLRLTESLAEIEQFERELTVAGWLKTPSNPAKKPSATPKQTILRLISPDGWQVYVGRSAAQNDEVTFKIGQPNDYWLHTRGRTGGHVIVRMQADVMPERTLEFAAELAAYYSSARHDLAVDVDMARRKTLRRGAGAAGLVHYTAERTIRVKPNKHEPRKNAEG
ncbi:MAG: NFACT family protein [Herpetosiphon sp.]|nr:NFACT family protein [Herpetosiphon sp.]